MKAKTFLAISVLVIGASVAVAAEVNQDHKVHHPDASSVTAKGSSTMPGGGMPMKAMQEHMQKMQAQMAEIHRTEDPDKRDKLIQSHMADMQEMMKMMHGGKSMMGQGGMMGQGMGMADGKKMAAPQGGMMGSRQTGMMEMMNRQQMVEQRMEMMQMMMDQMMQNRAATQETRMIREKRHDHRKMK